jgi:hypothetical protein
MKSQLGDDTWYVVTRYVMKEGVNAETGEKAGYLRATTKYDVSDQMKAVLEDMRDRCFRDMQRFIENCRKDSTPQVPAHETLTVMLQTLNDCGSLGFGDSAWQKQKPSALAAKNGARKK